MINFKFWQRWLVCVGVYLCVFGLYLAFFSQSKVMDVVFNQNIDPYFWVGENLPDDAYRFQGWIYGVLGAVVAGWGILITFWAIYAFQSREPWAWNGMAMGVGIWYVADTAISAIYGVGFNVIFNTILLIALTTPLIFTKRYFANTQSASLKKTPIQAGGTPHE